MRRSLAGLVYLLAEALEGDDGQMEGDGRPTWLTSAYQWRRRCFGDGHRLLSIDGCHNISYLKWSFYIVILSVSSQVVGLCPLPWIQVALWNCLNKQNLAKVTVSKLQILSVSTSCLLEDSFLESNHWAGEAPCGCSSQLSQLRSQPTASINDQLWE